MEFTLFLNTKYRKSLSLEASVGSDMSIQMMELFETDNKTFNLLANKIIQSTKKNMGFDYLGYAHGMLIFVNCQQALEAYQKEIKTRGHDGTIKYVVITDQVKETSLSSNFNDYSPAIVKVDGDKVYNNYPAILNFD